jgi:hypothetical protein
MKKILLIAILSVFTTISYGQNNSEKNNQPDSARVFVSFIAETDGSITNVKVDKIECKTCSKKYKKSIKEEAVRVVKVIPKLNEHKQRTKYVLPIKFKLED